MHFRFYSGSFVGTRAGLLEVLEGKDRAVLERSAAMKNGEKFDFEASYALLFAWCQETLQSV